MALLCSSNAAVERLSLIHISDGRGPIVATADGECAPCDAVEAVLRPLSGRILLPAPAYERFVAKHAVV